MKKILRKAVKFLGSLKFAVLVILALAIICAVGTFVESSYNSETALKLVYFSPYMKGVMIALVVSLTLSALDRLPWKKKHVGFLVVHLGLVTLIVGSFITHRWGLDGTVAFEIGEAVDYAMINQTDLFVYASNDGDTFVPFFREEVDFLLNRPEKKPLEFNIGADRFRIAEYMPYAFERRDVRPSTDTREGPAIRFQLANQMVNVTEWIVSNRSTADYKLGPAQILLGTTRPEPTGNNEILLWPLDKERINYEIRTKREGVPPKKGVTRAGEELETGWMSLKFRLINYLANAHQESVFERLERPTQVSTSAVRVEFNDQVHWVGLNSRLKMFKNDGVYILTYGSRLVPLGFPLRLKDFTVGRDPGSERAASYESLVNVEGLKDVTISMNEPLKHKGFTFYQASFSQDGTGRANTSVLSVNWDPGRWVKYAGSLCVVLGTIILFYQRRRMNQKSLSAGEV